MLGAIDKQSAIQVGNLYFGEGEAQIDIRGEFVASHSADDWFGVAPAAQIYPHLAYLRVTGSTEIVGPPYGTEPTVAGIPADVTTGFHLRVFLTKQSVTGQVLDAAGNVASSVERANAEQERWRGGLYIHTFFAAIKLSSVMVRPA